jgi:hypothetical protein
MNHFQGRLSLILVVISLLMSACAASPKMPVKIPKGSRIAVIANVRDEAVLQRVGTTVADNVSFYRQIPKFKINPYLTTLVSNDLYRSRQFKVIPIYHRTAPQLFDIPAVKKRVLSPQYRQYINRLSPGKKLDYIVLVTPADINFGKGQYYGPIWSASGYGLFNRAFMFIQTNAVFGAFNVYLIDARSFKMMAYRSGHFQTRSHKIDIAWHKGYSGVPASSLSEIKKLLRQNIPATVTKLVHQTGLP